MKRLSAGVLALLLVMGAGCGKQLRPIHPGAINGFDSVAYDTLLTSQAALEQAKVEVQDRPQYKTGLNQAIASYNTALALYRVYHEGSHSQIQLAELQGSLQGLATALAELQHSLGRKL